MKRLARKLLNPLGYDLVAHDPLGNTQQSHLLALIAKLDVTGVIDVGAHTGGFATMLRRAGYAGPIVSFEPVTENFRLLQEASANDGNWFCHRLALGAESATLEINVTARTDFSSFRRPSGTGDMEFGALVTVARQETVPVRRLDELDDQIRPAGPRLFLKSDTQGWELDVFRGARRVLERVVLLQAELPTVATYEGAPTLWEALPEYEAAGFRTTRFFPAAVSEGLYTVDADCVMVRYS